MKNPRDDDWQCPNCGCNEKLVASGIELTVVSSRSYGPDDVNFLDIVICKECRTLFGGGGYFLG